MTSGIVGGMKHQVLPSIPPWITLLLTVAAMLVRNHNCLVTNVKNTILTLPTLRSLYYNVFHCFALALIWICVS